MMNLGSRKCFDIFKYIYNYPVFTRSIFHHARSLSVLKLNNVSKTNYQLKSEKFEDITYLFKNYIFRDLVLDKRIIKLFPRFYADYPPHKVVILPNLSPTMETGSVLSWGRKEGEVVSEGDLLAEIETDKATMSMDASDSGIMAKILVPAGTKDIPIGTPLCVIVENESDVMAFKNYTTASISTKPAPQAESEPELKLDKQSPVTDPPLITASSSSSDDRIFISPYAKTLASGRGIDLKMLAGKGSGPGGRIRAADLDQIISAKSDAFPDLTTNHTDLELSNMRKVIAKRLCFAKQTIPHYNLTMDISMNKVLDVRANINKKFEKLGIKLSVNDFVIKAAAMACMKVVQCNSSWQETFIRQYNQVDMSVAVATPNGLITPIIFNAQDKGLKDINREMLLLATKAKENKLQPHEFQGGTFTVSNLGMFGITSFNAIINPPQACILAIGGNQERLIYDKSSNTGYSKVSYMSATLCCDHRVVDGAVGAKWLSEFRDNLEDPVNMLI